MCVDCLACDISDMLRSIWNVNDEHEVSNNEKNTNTSREQKEREKNNIGLIQHKSEHYIKLKPNVCHHKIHSQ